MQELIATYICQAGFLVEKTMERIPDRRLYRLTTGAGKITSKGPTTISIVGLAIFYEGLADHFNWADGKAVHTESTSQIRKRLGKQGGQIHVGLQKWQRISRWSFEEKKLWGTIWRKYRAPTENLFLWQVAY
jgi:hypothetical protein